MKREIIVGYDPEHAGEDVLELGRILSEVLAAKPRVITAIPWPDYLIGIVDLDEQMEVEMRNRFARIHDDLDDLGVETDAIASRTPASTLAEIAETDQAQVIVVGSSHHGPAGRTLAGSVGESLLQGASRAVAIAPRGYAERDEERLQRIAVAFDGSSESWAALETAIGLAERCHATVSVITVADHPKYGYAEAWSILAEGEFRDAERADKERVLGLAVSRIPKGLERESRVLTGDPAARLTEASDEFDLMVVGSRAWGPLKRTLLGSTTRKLIRSCACPVLVLPRGAGVDPLDVRVGPAAEHASP
jgi:nucleotide-binding universal stress UspA family protein